ncbi:MAG TPA: NADPH-dependent F420 reductase [Candidatus Lokiarchaeia archaeon]|nr:NADPH-dependent F420 reductase [Candidatus Lokiarchaeia archaeon]
MKISIIGTGNVGGALGQVWANQGHEILFGSRNAEDDRVQTLLEKVSNGACAGTIQEAAEFGEVVVLAVPWHAAQEIVESISEQLNDKILIECSNPLKPDMSGLAVDADTSAAEMVANWAPGAKVIKAFNSTGAGNNLNPVYGAEPISMFICGDDAGAKATVSDLTAQIGYDVVDCGPLSAARLLESLAMLWISLAYRQQLGPNIGFKLVRR